MPIELAEISVDGWMKYVRIAGWGLAAGLMGLKAVVDCYWIKKDCGSTHCKLWGHYSSNLMLISTSWAALMQMADSMMQSSAKIAVVATILDIYRSTPTSSARSTPILVVTKYPSIVN